MSEEQDGFLFQMQSSIGIELRDPVWPPMCEWVSYEYKYTWAEKRRDDLVWKMKTARATVNKIKVFLLMVLSVPAILVIILWLASFVNYLAIPLGIIGAYSMIFSYYIWIDIFECDPNHVRVIRKRKIHNY